MRVRQNEKKLRGRERIRSFGSGKRHHWTVARCQVAAHRTGLFRGCRRLCRRDRNISGRGTSWLSSWRGRAGPATSQNWQICLPQLRQSAPVPAAPIRQGGANLVPAVVGALNGSGLAGADYSAPGAWARLARGGAGGASSWPLPRSWASSAR